MSYSLKTKYRHILRFSGNLTAISGFIDYVPDTYTHYVLIYHIMLAFGVDGFSKCGCYKGLKILVEASTNMNRSM